jgi:hypothetical protein
VTIQPTNKHLAELDLLLSQCVRILSSVQEGGGVVGGVGCDDGSRPDLPEVRTSVKRDQVQRQKRPSIVRRPLLDSTHLNYGLAVTSSAENGGGEGGGGKGGGGEGGGGDTEGDGRRRVYRPADHVTWGACLSPLSPEVYIYAHTNTDTFPSPLYMEVCVCVCVCVLHMFDQKLRHQLSMEDLAAGDGGGGGCGGGEGVTGATCQSNTRFQEKGRLQDKGVVREGGMTWEAKNKSDARLEVIRAALAGIVALHRQLQV